MWHLFYNRDSFLSHYDKKMVVLVYQNSLDSVAYLSPKLEQVETINGHFPGLIDFGVLLKQSIFTSDHLILLWIRKNTSMSRVPKKN